MPSQLLTPASRPPLIYLITSGETSAQTTPATEDFARVLRLVEAAVDAKIDLLQIREKQLTGKTLYELALTAARITKGTKTKLLINDRADVAVAAGADGVHLTTSSIRSEIVRQAFGEELLIGASTHSLAEVLVARAGGADFVVYGPIFKTGSKVEYGEPVGLDDLARVGPQLAPFPVLALGGITVERAADCMRAGASGIAAIGMLQDPQKLADVVNRIRDLLEPPASAGGV